MVAHAFSTGVQGAPHRVWLTRWVQAWGDDNHAFHRRLLVSGSTRRDCTPQAGVGLSMALVYENVAAPPGGRVASDCSKPLKQGTSTR